jgi:type VI protein secretion system component VasF
MVEAQLRADPEEVAALSRIRRRLDPKIWDFRDQLTDPGRNSKSQRSLRRAASALQLGFAVVSLGLGAAALVALRGCPICWTIGLVETIWNALGFSAGGR